MGFVRSDNLRHTRALMRNSLSRYDRGEDMYPRYRFAGQPEALCPKALVAASLLTAAWNLIDSDRAYFRGSIRAISEHASGIVIASIGRNAVGVALKQPDFNEGAISVQIVSPKEFHERIDDRDPALTGGRDIAYVGGVLYAPYPDAIIDRPGSLSSLMIVPDALKHAA